jgi:carbon monoxide dehydrogenase subunit G
MTRTIPAIVITLLLTGAAGLLAAPGDRVAVREDKGTFHVTARFVVSAPAAAVLAVLTDYERIPEFAPGVRRSVVKERDGTRAVVEQEAVSKVMMFSRKVHLVLDIQPQLDALAFRDICGASFVSYQGSWQVEPTIGGTAVTYSLAADPAFDVPGFLLTRILRKDAADLIENLRREIERTSR